MNLKNRLKVGVWIGALMLFSGLAKGAEWTAINSRLVGEVIVDTTYYYIGTTTTTGWGAAGCPNFPYLLIARTEPNARELLSTLLTAKANGLKAYAYGTCSGASYFVTNYIVVN